MIRRLSIALMCFALAACAQLEAPALEEPIVDEIAREGVPDCDTGDEDGIGGTGCEPVARQRPDM